MRRCPLAFLGVIASFLVIASGSVAAQQGISEVRGRVVDSQNAILPGVIVLVTNQDSGIYREVTSNADGTYFVTGIVPGTYEVAAQLSGFKKSVRRDIVLSIGRTTTIDMQLEVGGVEETVTVTTQAPLVDVTSSEIGGNVTRDDIIEMPSVNRNYIEFLGLLPGRRAQQLDDFVRRRHDQRQRAELGVEQLHGRRRQQQRRLPRPGLRVAGAHGARVDPGVPGAHQSVRRRVRPHDRRRRQRDHQAGIQPVPRQPLQLLDRFVGDRRWTTSCARRTCRSRRTTKKQWGGTLGGPIVRDRAHYFVSLERIIINEGRSSVFTTRPDRNFAISQDTDVWNLLGRVDHQLSSNQTYSVR